MNEFDYLVQAGIDEENELYIVNTPGKANWNQALYYCCFKGKKNMINTIVSCGATDWNYALCGACAGGWTTIIDEIIQKGANKWNMAFCFACSHGQIETAKLMIANGADEYFYGFKNSCTKDSHRVAEFLLEFNLNYYDCLVEAINAGACRIINMILEKKKKRRWIVMACEKKDWNTLAFLSLRFIKN